MTLGVPHPTVVALSYRSIPLTAEIPVELLQRAIESQGSLIVSWRRNSFVRPPMNIVAMGHEKALEWLQDAQLLGEVVSNKLQLVLVGLEEAGKTTIARHMARKPGPERRDRTVGIEITPSWRPPRSRRLEVSVWDFAGQADYYASHQLFLTPGSLFLLVVDMHALLKDMETGVDLEGDPRGCICRWLEALSLRVPGAAVALVGTHIDAEEFRADHEKLENAIAHLRKRESTILVS